MKRIQKILINEILYALVLLFFSSCKTLAGGGFFQVITEKNLDITSDIVEQGQIVYDKKDGKENVISVNGFDYVSKRWFYGYRFRFKYDTLGIFYYGGIIHNVKLIYDFSRIRSTAELFLGDFEDLRGEFWNIDVKGFAPIYQFETISEQGILHRGSSIDCVSLRKNELPIVFSKFAIDGKIFSFLIDKSDNDSLYNHTEITYHDDEVIEESGLTRIRDLMTDENQKYLICDTENHICAEFTRNWYVLYASEDYDYKSLIPAIGVYAGIIRLMNTHYEYGK